MTFRIFSAAIAALIVPAAPALAQKLDEPVVEPVPVATAAAPVFAWDGAYAGAQLGYGYADTDASDADTNDDGIADTIQDTVDNIGEDGEGLIGGVHGGYNFQNNAFVYGGELDFDFADIELDDNAGDIEGLLRIKGKAGYSFGRTLLYGTVGGVYGYGEIADDDFDDFGWLAGAGVDVYATQNVTVGLEALFHDFEEFDDSDVDVSLTTVVARVSYRF